MKKLKNIVVAFVIFNCLSLAVFAACAQTIQINGATCKYVGLMNGFCWYDCPNGDVVARPMMEETPGGY